MNKSSLYSVRIIKKIDFVENWFRKKFYFSHILFFVIPDYFEKLWEFLFLKKCLS